VGVQWFKKSDEITTSFQPPAASYPQADMENSFPTIGWTGTHSTLKQLLPLFPVLEEIYRTHRFRFLLIADIAPEVLPSFVVFRKWNKSTEIEDLLEIDIGVMPLYDTDWEKGKCGFKALQYMALGIPTVVSDVGVNAEIIDSGKYGLLAEAAPFSNQTKWNNALTDLLENCKLRNELGAKGKTRILNSYSVLAFAEDYSNLFKPSVSGKNP
jgi:glycosyltransferase involved in cell wall biosynthesis